MRILGTGGSGFVGRALVPHLAAAGHTVAAPTRAETGDLGPETPWRDRLAGIEAVIHLAARVHVMQDDADDPLAAFRRINTAATKHLAAAAIEAGVRRFVYLSSVKVNGESGEHPYGAGDPPDPRDPYGVSKVEAEAALAAAGTALETVILRPPLVYGPGVKGNFRRLLGLVDRGLPLPLASVRNRRSLIYLGNLVSAIEAALTVPPGLFLPSDRNDLSTPELLRGLALALDRPARLFPCPVSLLRLGGAMAGQGPAVARLTDSLRVDGALPGWAPPHEIETGLLATARWWRDGGDDRTN